MRTSHDVSKEEIQDWVMTLDQICRSDEIRELVQRLRYEDGAYPQTVVTIEEE